MNFHVGADDEFDNDNRANAATRWVRDNDWGSLNKWMCGSWQHREAKASRPFAVVHAAVSEESALPWTVTDQPFSPCPDITPRPDNSPGTLDMPLRPGRQVIHSELAEVINHLRRLARRCDVPCWRLSAEAVMLDSWQRFM